MVLLNKGSDWPCMAHIVYIYSLLCIASITKIESNYHVSGPLLSTSLPSELPS